MQIIHDQELGRVATETTEVFSLRKGDWVALCNLTSPASQHDPTWELQLFVGTPDNELMAAYCDSQGEVFTLLEKWKTKLLEKGWSKCARETSGDSYNATPEQAQA
jgi:hypothetical protein